MSTNHYRVVPVAPAGPAPSVTDWGFVPTRTVTGTVDPQDYVMIEPHLGGFNYDGVSGYTNGNGETCISGFDPSYTTISETFERTESSEARVNGYTRASAGTRQLAFKMDVGQGDWTVQICSSLWHSGTFLLGIAITPDLPIGQDPFAQNFNQYDIASNFTTNRTYANGVDSSIAAWPGGDVANRVPVTCNGSITCAINGTAGTYLMLFSMRVTKVG